LHIPCYSW